MEPNISGISRKLWNIVRVAIYMIRKGLCKKKIFMDLNMMMKRGKIAGKAAFGKIMHHHHHHNDDGGPSNNPDDGPREYEFSCSNTPLYRQLFTSKRRKHQNNNNDRQYYFPSPLPMEESDNVDLEEVNNMLEMMLSNESGGSRGGGGGGRILAASPLLPGLGFGRSPAVRQLRITDSPFPVQNGEDDKHVDQAAEDFINKFYSQLLQQKFYSLRPKLVAT